VAAGSEAAWRLHIPWGEVGVLLLLLAGVVVSDILKGKAACASLFYWLAATAMLPATLATQLAVRCALGFCTCTSVLCCLVAALVWHACGPAAAATLMPNQMECFSLSHPRLLLPATCAAAVAPTQPLVYTITAHMIQSMISSCCSPSTCTRLQGIPAEERSRTASRRPRPG
jgi:Tfp pilus assembly protein PilX